jgi:hypothetical protein
VHEAQASQSESGLVAQSPAKPLTEEEVADMDQALGSTLSFIAEDTPASLLRNARADSMSRAAVCKAAAATIPVMRPRRMLPPPSDNLVSHPSWLHVQPMPADVRASWQARCASVENASLEALALNREALSRPASTKTAWLKAQERSEEAGGGLLWSGSETLIFLVRFILHPKDFERIASYLPRRTPADCAALYYRIKHVAGLKQTLRLYRQGVRRREGRPALQSAADCADRLGLRVPRGWWTNAPTPVTTVYTDGVPVRLRHSHGPYNSLVAGLLANQTDHHRAERLAASISASQLGAVPVEHVLHTNMSHWVSVFGSEPFYLS